LSQFRWWCERRPRGVGGERSLRGKKSDGLRFSAAFMGTLQDARTLIARAEEVTKSPCVDRAIQAEQQGTLVYRGHRVLRHVQYNNAARAAPNQLVRTKWGIVNKRTRASLIDPDGIRSRREYKEPEPETPGGSTPYLPVTARASRAWLDEVMSFRRIAWPESRRLRYVGAGRVVTSEAEKSPRKTIYAGDLWGLRRALGEMDPKLIARPMAPAQQPHLEHPDRRQNMRPSRWRCRRRKSGRSPQWNAFHSREQLWRRTSTESVLQASPAQSDAGQCRSPARMAIRLLPQTPTVTVPHSLGQRHDVRTRAPSAGLSTPTTA